MKIYYITNGEPVIAEAVELIGILNRPALDIIAEEDVIIIREDKDGENDK